uniref:Anaphase-promoting complex subunit 4 WD40 domain-containing protein n=1 Tax=Paramoeba aestuarina TaxID=180227 RepID=A0A7S4KT93_9EUKA|mmetsp:Transcript_24688/g.38486  ORF Transcript_24688/g.38486 Transcript_24688/m.38486 type:complete len:328 (+) Transcript_24688:94-1077(+)|eukprot:CAMPEP_0201524496 /NCGR_PEP_ID=MMETSP0161_2-20130828/22753_1 /ASSEMBLY_ACC=CAM_ASM_000251 /TAXON_ID=180227 /ORGANISM="Neoparamoeba aestuarina, Strain SoJaBio B1-5/56/2" /LENGTH=327 /DNA_ID=CAMNT_0047923919 /DNA_START=69 /DNA_END=1052 /DNA_ORIENTATION=-
MAMRQFKQFPTKHTDILHDVSYDYYGKRIATSSSDGQVKVFDLDERGEWYCSSTLPEGHRGAVFKVDWAHPEFGQVLASCSFDKQVVIWEERPVADKKSDKNSKMWKNVAFFVDSREPVYDVKFAPQHLGLKVATCSGDGNIRIYEAVDVMNLSNWSMIHQFHAFAQKAPPSSNHGMSLSWNTSTFDPASLVVAGMGDKNPRIWEYNESHRVWQTVGVLEGNEDLVNDVAWAPNVGRSYELIATAGKDGSVRIWKVKREEEGVYRATKESGLETARKDPVSRVQWNSTGTILASSCDDGSVRMWKNNFFGKWSCLSVVQSSDGNGRF